MHKEEASRLFEALGDEQAVKTMKMVYNNGPQNFDDLYNLVGGDKASFKEVVDKLLITELLVLKDDLYSVDEELLEQLLTFIKKPCGNKCK